MKNIKSAQTGEVRRVSDNKAERLVRTGQWAYVPKKQKDADGKLVSTICPAGWDKVD